ncbi:MAG: M14 family metallopeptidase [Polaribacter sp.]|nr:M14 family metallopeptidase [Polaribacter sp.]
MAKLKTIFYFLLLILILSCAGNKNSTTDFTTPFEKSKGTETPEYKEVIAYYQQLSNSFDEISMFTFGQTDSGEPLHLLVYNQQGIKNIDVIKRLSKNKILINNGIHPGESDGIDASMLFLRDLVQSDSLKQKYQNSIICIIPVYNIGGALNRNSHSRTNQNGPIEYGFRGNARNYDLNRDFIKQDTKNAAAFAEIFHTVNPDIFIDNHVSNGADYQYAITHLFTQHNKLGGELGAFLEEKMRPEIENSLLNKGIDITPYVNVWGNTPEAGFSQFFDSPRYSTGYTSLFHTLGLMVETHMLKPYKIRVEQTYELLFSTLDFTEKNSKKIKELRSKATHEIVAKRTYPIQYEVDNEKFRILNFKGFEGELMDSKVTTGKRLFYNQNKPFVKEIKYFDSFKTTKEIQIPKAYILQQGWHDVLERLKNNRIEFTRFEKDTTILVEVRSIADFKTQNSPYEGHYLHYNTSISQKTEDFNFKKGDIYIPTNQFGVRYLLETLEAEATDSFFNWNFFDTILQQKEGYSGYVFEDIAEKLLLENPELKMKLDEKQKTDADFAKNPRAQLDFVFKNSPHYEKVHLRLPIFKIY